MVRKTLTLAAIAAIITGGFTTAMAQERVDPGMLHWIRDTVCKPGSDIVFVPVSNDVKTRHRTWAVIDMSNPDPDTAHIVDAAAKSWLVNHGCDEPPAAEIHVAEHAPRSSRLGF